MAFPKEAPLNNSLYQLDHCPDVATLRDRLHSLFLRFGAIARLDIIDIVQAGRRQAMCFLRMESPEQERRLARELRLGRFGGDLVVIVDLNLKHAANDGSAPAMVA